LTAGRAQEEEKEKQFIQQFKTFHLLCEPYLTEDRNRTIRKLTRKNKNAAEVLSLLTVAIAHLKELF